MIDKSCGECSKIRTEFCTRPDECVIGGYKDFQDPYALPEKFCQKCKTRLKRPASKKLSDNYRVVRLVCPACGNRTFLHMEVKSKE